MTMAPKRVCPGCRRNKADYGALCDACETKGKGKVKQQGYDKRRGSASKRGYDRHWQKVRLAKLDRNPLCECDRCLVMERTRAANTVHHIKPVETHPHLRLVDSNLASMAGFCHEVEEGRAVDYEYLSWESDLKGKGFFKS